MPSALPQWLVFALLAAVFAALTNIFGKIGVADIPSNFATLIRIVVIFAFTTVVVFARGEWSNPVALPSRTLLFLVLSGLATGLSWLCGFRALQLGQASQVGPVDKLSVVLVMIAGVLFLGEQLNWKQWLGGVLILCGVLLVASPSKNEETSPGATVASLPRP
ncbi:MAG TPA: EamA family transporter [Planctomycetota bacterium]|nr:EamA family transporter [Planctomycetota bacterium]